ncbi:MAG: hypothetical protein IID36_03730 [Planctomycetes bacterium]|nr:hypothetical protein [Planctomycetota bacterium]
MPPSSHCGSARGVRAARQWCTTLVVTLLMDVGGVPAQTTIGKTDG